MLRSILSSERPLVVDLDRTLIVRDIFMTLLTQLVLRKFWLLPQFLLAYVRGGKPRAKSFVADNITFDLANMPLNVWLIDELKAQKKRGREVWLCTGANAKHARVIAEYLGFFDGYFASSDSQNLTGHKKAEFLAMRFGPGNFDYVGDSHKDIPVAALSNNSFIVAAHTQSPDLPGQLGVLRSVIRIMRIKHWLKNLLIFTPLVTAHRLVILSDDLSLLALFVAFSLLASGTYVLNDLFDIESDSVHPEKSKRPLASGSLSVGAGWALFAGLVAVAFAIALAISTVALYCSMAYFALTILYSAKLKAVQILDIITLATLYTLRIVAGTLVLNLKPSFWILAFSVFIFFALATVKRLTELQSLTESQMSGRAYIRADIQVLALLGVGASYAASLVFAVYINSFEVQQMYNHPTYLWGAFGVLIYWIAHLWIEVLRGKVSLDPIEWAAKDLRSILSAVAILFIIALANF